MKTSTPSFQSPSRPSLRPAAASPSSPSFGASAAKAVLHDLAKSVRNGTVPNSKLFEFLNDRPSTLNVFGQATGPSRLTAPASSRPRPLTILKVEPGGTCAAKARFSALPPLATATSAPSLIRSATRAPRCLTVASAVSAAVCVITSSVVRTGVPGFGS